MISVFGFVVSRLPMPGCHVFCSQCSTTPSLIPALFPTNLPGTGLPRPQILGCKARVVRETRPTLSKEDVAAAATQATATMMPQLSGSWHGRRKYTVYYIRIIYRDYIPVLPTNHQKPSSPQDQSLGHAMKAYAQTPWEDVESCSYLLYFVGDPGGSIFSTLNPKP